MLIKTNLDEVKKRETALFFINEHIQKNGRRDLYDLTGLSGAYLLKKEDFEVLETYVGPAVFEKMLDEYGKAHLGGEKILGFNRTSAGILATILALVKKDSTVVHYLPELPSHPSIPRSTRLVRGHYLEFDNLKDFILPENTSLVVITGSTMDHKVISEEEFKQIIKKAHSHSRGKIPVLVDDASGARLRTIVFNQPSAMDLGADLVVTSTDKLMDGPRGGLMAGESFLIDEIKSKAHQFGLEAQAPLVAGMVRALEQFDPENILNSLDKKKKLKKLLNQEFEGFNETPTGVMILPRDIALELEKRNIDTLLSPDDLSFLWAMILLKEYGVITIPAVGMPGASPTLRLDMASFDGKKLELNEIKNILKGSFKKLEIIAPHIDKSKDILFKNR
ncbi:MAG: TIGR03576 family pyridoxal phosphate-dependent enzyme [Methanobacterium sp.]|nr:MAG: TIGR03576 family pyridoxal phosphate-dependent enzyme [Methanobacterium sp.]